MTTGNMISTLYAGEFTTEYIERSRSGSVGVSIFIVPFLEICPESNVITVDLPQGDTAQCLHTTPRHQPLFMVCFVGNHGTVPGTTG